MNCKWKQFAGFFLSCAVLIGLDQWTKALAVGHLKGQNPIVLLEGVFELTYLENRGAAFGMLQGRQGFFFLISAVVIAAALFALWRMPTGKRFLPLYFSAIGVVAGAVGNMIDRTVQGYVVDFFYFRLINFPVFNVADCYVTVAAAALVFLLLFYYKESELEPFSLKRKKGESL